jgi:hypothetical protein
MADGNHPNRQQTLNDALEARHREKKRRELASRQRLFLLCAVFSVTALVTAMRLDLAEPVPMHNSILTRQLWLDELIARHEQRFKASLGMAKSVFFRLSYELQLNHGLASSKFVTADEKLATFLHFARTGSSNRMLQERFQRSAETISKYVLSCSFMSTTQEILLIDPSTLFYTHLWAPSTPNTYISPTMQHHRKSRTTQSSIPISATAAVQ